MTEEAAISRRRVATVGMFDGVHLGHQLVVAQVRSIACERGLVPTVFSFDAHPAAVIAPEKAPRQLSTLSQRAEGLVRAGTDEVVFLPFAEIRHLSASDFLHLLSSKYGVDVLVVGFNHHFGRGGKGSFDDYRLMGAEIGIEVVRANEYIAPSLQVPVSSSTIRHLLSTGQVEAANLLLGHAYSLSGMVVHGRSIGHNLGFPTANLRPFLSNPQLPGSGVYAAKVGGSTGCHAAMVNIGTNPTVATGNAPISIEAHLIDFSGNLYGSVIDIEFIARLRDERKFDSVDDLVAQLHADKARALTLLSDTSNAPKNS